MLKRAPIILSLFIISAQLCWSQLISPEFTQGSNDRLYATVGGNPIAIPNLGNEEIEHTTQYGFPPIYLTCKENRDYFYYASWNNGNPTEVFEEDILYIATLNEGNFLEVKRYIKGYSRTGGEIDPIKYECTTLNEKVEGVVTVSTNIVITDILFEDGSDYLEYDLCYRESDRILLIDNNINITSQGYFNEDGIITSDAYLATSAPLEVIGNGIIEETSLFPASVPQSNPKLFYFDATQAQDGDNLVTVRLNFHNGVKELTINFKKDEEFISQSIESQEVCLGEETEITGFEFDGDNLTITSDNPAINGLIRKEDGKFYFTAYDNVITAGEYDLKITGSKGICENSVTRKIAVINPVELQFNLPEVFCKDELPVNLNTLVEPIGGTFTSVDIPNFNLVKPILDPSTLLPEGVTSQTYKIRYSMNDNCAEDVVKTFTVYNASQSIAFTLPNTLCRTPDAAPISLFDYVDIKGGVFSSNSLSITNGELSLVGASLGNHTITYTTSNENVPDKCTSTTEVAIEIVEGIPTFTFNLPAAVCQDIEALNLLEYVGQNPAEDISFNIGANAITNPTSWQIGELVGDYIITCTVSNDADCERVIEKSITINPRVPTLSFELPESVCQSITSFSLEDLVNIKGGVFSSTSLNVVGGTFTPNEASIGTHFIEYRIVNGEGCIGAIEQAITVLQPPPDFELTFPDAMCQNEQGGILDLEQYTSVTGGVFLMDTKIGIQELPNNKLNIRDITGTITLLYSIENESNECTLEKSKTLTILEAPIGVEFSIPDYCKENRVIDLFDHVNVANGLFSSNSLAYSNSTFDLSSAQVGEHTINYTVTSESGCDTTLTSIVRVGEFFPIEAGDNVSLCLSNPVLDLTGKAIPDGGMWQGTGIVEQNGTYQFNGNNLAPATFPLIYTYDNGGCIQNDTMSITVVRDDQIDFSADKTEVTQGEKVNFEANILNAQSYSWNFGQSEVTSDLPSTSFIYYGNYDEEERYFTVSLDVDLGGCAKEIIKPDYIKLTKESTVDDVVTGVLEKIETQIAIHPSPFSATLTVDVPIANYQLKIFNATGKLIWQAKSTGKALINTIDWSTGMYTILLIKGNEFLTKKAIKR